MDGCPHKYHRPVLMNSWSRLTRLVYGQGHIPRVGGRPSDKPEAVKQAADLMQFINTKQSRYSYTLDLIVYKLVNTFSSNEICTR